jgi:hypothetical protein
MGSAKEHPSYPLGVVGVLGFADDLPLEVNNRIGTKDKLRWEPLGDGTGLCKGEPSCMLD